MPPKLTGDDLVKDHIKRITEAKGDWFKTLGLEVADTTVDSLKKAYRALVLTLHPDKCKVTGARDAFQEADKAYKALSDPDTLNKFKEAQKKQSERDDYVKNKSTLEKFLGRSKEGVFCAESAEAAQRKMETEMSPEERAKYNSEKQQREFLLRREREIKERLDRRKRTARQKDDDEVEEAELQNNIGQWRNFQGAKRQRQNLPAMKQNVGAVRQSDLDKSKSAAPDMDYKNLRKNWQNHSLNSR